MTVEQGDLLGEWVARSQATAARQPAGGASGSGVRFAFYGRTSTVEYQDRFSSYGWQREMAETLIADRGAITADFFDAGCSRRVPWRQRPQAAALLSALAEQDRAFDAIVVGEYERAFLGDQFVQMAAVFQYHGVQVWLPEAGGAVDMDDPMHQALVTMLGAQSNREVIRSRHRVLAAMRAQATGQGRYLGGRPPYGYRLIDAGPHPNAAHAQWGRRLRQLNPDPATAPKVRWIFAQRLTGRSIASIARELNDQAVPCPSGMDPDRNPHRTGDGWTLRTVAMILRNPRYTGRQVWNRQSTQHDGHQVVHRSNPAQAWAISETVAHPPLISERDFVAVQAIKTARPTDNGQTRTYALAGLLRCRHCGRRMDSHWVNHRPGYRCRHGHSSARGRAPSQRTSIYVREDALLVELAARLRVSAYDDDRRLQPLSASGIGPLLRSRNMIVAHDGSNWTLEPAEPPTLASHQATEVTMG